jgi:uncharacterized LabA/DUF88 family protein
MPDCAIFIDGGYLDKTMRNEHQGASIDYDKLATEMAGGLNRYRAYYYFCRRWMPANPTTEDRRLQADQDRFFERIRCLPRFEVRLGHLRRRGTDSTTGRPILQQKGVDVLLAIDVVRIALRGGVAQIALLAGDGDYLPLVKVAKDAGVITRLYHAQGTTESTKYSPELWSECDERVALDAALVTRVRRIP